VRLLDTLRLCASLLFLLVLLGEFSLGCFASWLLLRTSTGSCRLLRCLGRKCFTRCLGGNSRFASRLLTRSLSSSTPALRGLFFGLLCKAKLVVFILGRSGISLWLE
jgi:hypothetical protein